MYQKTSIFISIFFYSAKPTPDPKLTKKSSPSSSPSYTTDINDRTSGAPVSSGGEKASRGLSASEKAGVAVAIVLAVVLVIVTVVVITKDKAKSGKAAETNKEGVTNPSYVEGEF